MRIAIFTDSFVPQVNGVSVSCMMLYKGLIELGNEVFVITTEHRNVKEKEKNIIRLSGFDVPIKSFDGFQLVPTANKYYPLIKEMNLDIIHVHTEFSIGRFGVRCAQKFKIPYVYTMHTMYEDYMHHVIKYGKVFLKKPYLSYVQRLVRWFSKKASAIVLPHEKVREMFVRYDLKKNIHIVPTGLDLDLFYRKNYPEEQIKALKESLGIKDEFVLLYVGRVAAEKSIDILISEYAKFSKEVNAKMVIVGDGPYMGSLERLVKSLDMEKEVVFTGMVPWTSVGLYYMIGDCFLNASITETQGLTYIEALSSNLPVIVRYDKNLEGLIENGKNGLFYNKPEELGGIIKMLINDSDLTNKLKENAYPSVKKYSKGNYSKTINDLYKSILSK